MTHLSFPETIQGLLAGDFTRLDPLFVADDNGLPCPIVRWHQEGLFTNQPEALAEAFTCACFNGRIPVIEYLLAQGVDSSGGIGTGLNAFHWAAERGQLEAVEILIREQTPLETLNSYGGTVLGCVVWSANQLLRPTHLQIIRRLLEAGADVKAAAYPSGNAQVDEMLRQFGAANR